MNHPVFIIPFWIFIALVFITWAKVMHLYVYKPFWKQKVDDYFAKRRHLRRMARYARSDVDLARRLHERRYGRHNTRKMVIR